MTDAMYIGIDIGKAELVVATPTAVIGTFPNDRGGHRDLVKRLAKLSVAAVVMESTGCYGRAVMTALASAGYKVAIVPPGRIRHFALSLGVRAKTDPIDACMIAKFGESQKPRTWEMPPEALSQLRALVDRRDQIVEMRKMEVNHLETCADARIAKEVRRSIAHLDKMVRGCDRLIAQHIAAHEPMRRLSDALQEETGVGLQTAAVLLAYMPELGTLNRQQAAALVGFAPYNRESGQSKCPRQISGGRRRLRRALYMAATTAARCSEWLKPMYVRLLQRGKLKKVACVACGRKLIIRLNSIAAKALAEMSAPAVLATPE